MNFQIWVKDFWYPTAFESCQNFRRPSLVKCRLTAGGTGTELRKGRDKNLLQEVLKKPYSLLRLKQKKIAKCPFRHKCPCFYCTCICWNARSTIFVSRAAGTAVSNFTYTSLRYLFWDCKGPSSPKAVFTLQEHMELKSVNLPKIKLPNNLGI